MTISTNARLAAGHHGLKIKGCGIILLASCLSLAAGEKRYAPPLVSCAASTQTSISLRVCAGSTSSDLVGGAPGGFSIEWAELPDVNGDGTINGDDCNSFMWRGAICRAVFSDGARGCNCNESPRQDYLLGVDRCVTVKIGDLFDDEIGVTLDAGAGNELIPGRKYVFRAFARGTGAGSSATQRSAYTTNSYGQTADCLTSGPCRMIPQGRWRERTGDLLARTSMPALPVCACGDAITNGLCLRSGDCYSAAGIVALLKTRFQGPGAQNKLGRLAHRVVAVELSFLENCGGIPSPGDRGIGNTLTAAHAALRNGDAEASSILAPMLSAYIEENISMPAARTVPSLPHAGGAR